MARPGMTMVAPGHGDRSDAPSSSNAGRQRPPEPFPSSLRRQVETDDDAGPDAPAQIVATPPSDAEHALVVERLQPRPRPPEFGCQQAVETQAGWKGNRQLDLQMRPVAGFAQDVLGDAAIRKLVDPLRLRAGFKRS
jgi:hypothetical protein